MMGFVFFLFKQKTAYEMRISDWSSDGCSSDLQEAAIAKRLDQLDRRMTRMERDLGIAVETLAIFVRFWLSTTPALPEPAAQAARAKAGERYEAFVAALGRRLANGPKLRQEIPDDIEPSRASEEK